MSYGYIDERFRKSKSYHEYELIRFINRAYHKLLLLDEEKAEMKAEMKAIVKKTGSMYIGEYLDMMERFGYDNDEVIDALPYDAL